jgi:ABC-type uncharacterized transport system involved in gliding motility auxiliary subunit
MVSPATTTSVGSQLQTEVTQSPASGSGVVLDVISNGTTKKTNDIALIITNEEQPKCNVKSLCKENKCVIIAFASLCTIATLAIIPLIIIVAGLIRFSNNGIDGSQM